MSQKPVCARIRLQPDSLERVRAWAAHINMNKDAALATLQNESVSIESVFLDSSKDGDFLVYYMRAASHEQAQEVARQSTAAIDQYHQKFKRDTWLEVRHLELLVDLDNIQ